MKTSNIISTTLLISIFLFSCGKKSDSGASESSMTPDLDDPATLMELSLGSLNSIGSEVSAGLSKTGVYLADNDLVFNSADCTDRGEPQARSTDGPNNMDEQGRLLVPHPRYALQDFYCKIHHDTGSTDSFVRAVANSRFLLCLVGKIRYDGQEHPFVLSHDQLATCLNAEPSARGGASGKVTASLQPKFGVPGAWNAGLHIVVPDLQIDAKVLLKLDANRLSVATLGSGLDEDAYLLAIDRSRGEVRFEGKLQRYGIAENSDAAGWNRHIRTYIKGSLDADYRLTGVDNYSAIYSEVSRMKLDGSPADTLQQGSYWTLNGSRTGGAVSHAGRVVCSFDSTANINICSDPNRSASWVDDYALACDGQTADNNCETEGIILRADSDTQFFMVPTHAAFEKASVWFEKIGVPLFTVPTFRISE